MINPKSRKSIYLAGPYSSTEFMQGLNNMSRGIRIGARLIKLGFSVFDPFLDVPFIYFENLTREDYLEHSIAQVSRQDYMYTLLGWETSSGTQAELKEATTWNVPVFFEENISPEELAETLLGVTP